MTNHKEILRLKNLGLSNAEIAAACCCGRNTVTRTLKRASETGLNWNRSSPCSLKKLTQNSSLAAKIGFGTAFRIASISTERCRRAVSHSACSGQKTVTSDGWPIYFHTSPAVQ